MTRNPRGEGHRLRRRLIEAASQVLEQVGDADRLAIRPVVAAAGVTAPALYRHFPDKRALLRAVLQERFDQFQQVLDAAGASASDPLAALRERSLAYVQYGLDHPGHYRVMFSSVNAGPGTVGEDQEHPGAGAFNALVDSVRRCLGAGADQAPVLAMQLWAALHGIVDLRITKPELPWPSPAAMVELALLPVERAA
jgi:AcrR family transcriptional regulator